MRKRPEFSVVLPTRNRLHLLSRAVRSVFDQSFGDFELIVVDDASTDATESWLSEIHDPRLEVLRRNESLGPSAARNEALRHCRGRYIVFLDDDDELLPEMLQSVRHVFERASPEVAFLWCGVEKVRDSNGATELVKRLVWPAPKSVYRYPESLLHLGAGTGFGLGVRRDAAEQVGPFDESLRAAVDFDWLLRLGLAFAYTVIPEVLVRVHLHRASQVTDPTLDKADSFDRILSKHRSFLSRHPEVQRLILHKAASLYYELGHRKEGRARAWRMVKDEPARLAGWKSLLFFELFGTEQLGLRRRLEDVMSTLGVQARPRRTRR